MTEAADISLVATGDIALMAGVPTVTVRQWVARGLMPEPVATTSAGRVWNRATIAVWLAKRGYPRVTDPAPDTDTN